MSNHLLLSIMNWNKCGETILDIQQCVDELMKFRMILLILKIKRKMVDM